MDWKSAGIGYIVGAESGNSPRAYGRPSGRPPFLEDGLSLAIVGVPALVVTLLLSPFIALWWFIPGLWLPLKLIADVGLLTFGVFVLTTVAYCRAHTFLLPKISLFDVIGTAVIFVVLRHFFG